MSEGKIEVNLKKVGDLWTATIDGQDYGFRKWTWGEKNDLSSKCTRVNFMTGASEFDNKYFNEQMFLATVRKKADGKFTNFTLEELRTSDSQLIDMLFKISQELNLVKLFETRNL